MKGKFIVIEGGDGSGKDTQIELLRKELGEENTIWTREPGGTAAGTEIRKILLSDALTDVSAKTELLLFYASRAEHLEKIIIPALEEGKNVISNRFSLTTLAYQIYGRERFELLDFCKILDAQVVGLHQPDLTILIDVPPEVAVRRLSARPNEINRLDSVPLSVHIKRREGYLKELKHIPSEIINGDGSAEKVFADFLPVVKKSLLA